LRRADDAGNVARMSEASQQFAGRVVVLTGVGRTGQLGEVVAAGFAEAGAALHLFDRTPDEVEARARALRERGHDATAHAVDLTDAAAVAEAVGMLRTRRPDGVDALVHMAGGFASGGTVADSDATIWDRMIAINLVTAHVTTRATLPLLRPRGGVIIYFGSVAALPGGTGAGMAAYAAAKSGVLALMRAVAAEEAKHGVRANAVAPTAIRTAENVASMGADAKYVERETVAATVRFLCSPAASAINGQVIRLG
jgi:NAD(P)-dependent dehydrogenase (short-subunit alcohol dehydrogenase family)